jgi:hypothetical protein
MLTAVTSIISDSPVMVCYAVLQASVTQAKAKVWYDS